MTKHRPSRHHLLLLFLLASAAFIGSRNQLTCFDITVPGASTPLPTPTPQSWNSTFLRIASAESAAPYGFTEVRDFLTDRSTTTTTSPEPFLRNTSATNLHQTIRIRISKWPGLLPPFRRAFLDWSRSMDLRLDPSSLVNDLQPGASSLPSTSRSRFSSCAVVGNSGILLKRSYGPLIDAHDVVMRLNNARTSGFEMHVGRKTNVSFVNSNILFLCCRRRGCPCHPYGHGVPLVMYVCQALHLLDYVRHGSSYDAPVLVTDARFDRLCAQVVKYYSVKRFAERTGRPPEEWGKELDAGNFHYSSGLQAVMLAAGACEKVSIFGFGKSMQAKHHYHSNQRRELDLHDYEAEYELYADLAARPEVVPFLRDAGFEASPLVIYR